MVILALLQLIHCFGWVKRPREFLNLQPFWCQSIPSSKSLPVHLPRGFRVAAPMSFQHFTPNNPTIHPEVSTKTLHSEKSYWGDVSANKNTKKKKKRGGWLQSSISELRICIAAECTFYMGCLVYSPQREGQESAGQKKKRIVKNTNNINDTLYKMTPI